MKIGISACLLGEKVRYDGTHKRNDTLLDLLKGHELIGICPEREAGFPIPHEPLEIRGDRVFTSSGKDVTEQLSEGAKRCLDRIADCDLLILKSKSSSCGIGRVYDGSFTGKLIEGDGVFAALCRKKKIALCDENDLERIKALLNGQR